MAASKVELEQSAARLEQIQAELLAMLVAVPNLPHESVPVGSDESAANGSAPLGHARQDFDFEVKDHVDGHAAGAGLRHGREALGLTLHR